MNDLLQVQAIVSGLAEAGIITSFCFGPSFGVGNVWTVNCQTRDFQEFSKPFEATSLTHAAAIAKLECHLRGWD